MIGYGQRVAPGQFQTVSPHRHHQLDYTKLSPEQRLHPIGEIWDSLEQEALPLERRTSTHLGCRITVF